MHRITRIGAVFTLAATAALAIAAEVRQQAARAKAAEPRVESNLIFGMHSGLALLTDVHYPAEPDGYAIIFIPGSGGMAPLGYSAELLNNERGQFELFAKPLVDAGCTVFVIEHRATPLFRAATTRHSAADLEILLPAGAEHSSVHWFGTGRMLGVFPTATISERIW